MILKHLLRQPKMLILAEETTTKNRDVCYRSRRRTFDLRYSLINFPNILFSEYLELLEQTITGFQSGARQYQKSVIFMHPQL